MILAMRDGNVAALDGFRDISGFGVALDQALANLAGLTTDEYRRRKTMEEASQEAPLVNDPFHMVRASLAAQGFSRKEADALINEAESEVPSGYHLLIVRKILELVGEAGSARSARKAPRRPKTEPRPIEDPKDVRNQLRDDRPGAKTTAA